MSTKKDTSKEKAVKAASEAKKVEKSTTKPKKTEINEIRLPSERMFELELQALIANDTYSKPPNWLLSPRMVELYVLGADKPLPLKVNGKKKEITITPKYFGQRDLIQKSIVTLASERALMLIGEPGTGKSWLSEHLTAGICGNSTYLIQGTAGTTEDQIRYTWNYALLIAEGPSDKALIPSPTMNAMKNGKILRFEEITRCPQEIQDSMISILSEKILPVPELGLEYYISANQGFNVIATANDRDRGVNEMSAALKRRFNFIYIPVIEDINTERKIVEKRVNDMMENLDFQVQIPEEMLSLLTTSFHELRNGKSLEGGSFKRISSVMSTSEEISLLFDSCIYSKYFSDETVKAEHIAMSICDTIVKDDRGNIPILQEYLNLIVKPRTSKNRVWKEFYDEFKTRIGIESKRSK